MRRESYVFEPVMMQKYCQRTTEQERDKEDSVNFVSISRDFRVFHHPSITKLNKRITEV